MAQNQLPAHVLQSLCAKRLTEALWGNIVVRFSQLPLILLTLVLEIETSEFLVEQYFGHFNRMGGDEPLQNLLLHHGISPLPGGLLKFLPYFCAQGCERIDLVVYPTGEVIVKVWKVFFFDFRHDYLALPHFAGDGRVAEVLWERHRDHLCTALFHPDQALLNFWEGLPTSH